MTEAVFLGMPKAHQEKYAEKHNEVETDLAALKDAFSQYHAADVRNGALARILKEREAKKRGGKPSSSSRDKRRRIGRRDHSGGRSGGRHQGDHHDRRDRRDFRRDRDRDRNDYRGRGHQGDRRDDRAGDRNNADRKAGGHKGSGGNQRPYKKPEAAHHVDDERSASSRSRASTRSPTPRRSPSPSYAEEEAEDAYMAEEAAYAASKGSDERAAQLPIEELHYSDEEKSRHDSYYGSRQPSRGWRSLLPKRPKRQGSAPR